MLTNTLHIVDKVSMPEIPDMQESMHIELILWLSEQRRRHPKVGKSGTPKARRWRLVRLTNNRLQQNFEWPIVVVDSGQIVIIPPIGYISYNSRSLRKYEVRKDNLQSIEKSMWTAIFRETISIQRVPNERDHPW